MFFTEIWFYLVVVALLVLSRIASATVLRVCFVIISYLIYGTIEPWYCLILFASTAIDFVVAQQIEHAPTKAGKSNWLALSLVSNLGLLGLFKYLDFGLENVNILLTIFDIPTFDGLNLVLPIGISFYTFQTLSYTLDVYRGKQKASNDLLGFTLYIAFFPQLVAGPIERAGHLLTQLQGQLRGTLSDIEYGVQRIFWGVMKKVVFADRFAELAIIIYQHPERFTSAEIMVGMLAFVVQIYLDFSAYTDIAIGLSRLFGIRLNENFNYPYCASNVLDFWSRWHMTLTAWFRDYVFKPLGGVHRHSKAKTSGAIMLTMVLIGLWHGASWNFIIFGLLHGILIIMYMSLRLGLGQRQVLGDSNLSRVFSIGVTFGLIFLLSVFFKADSLANAFSIYRVLFAGTTGLSTHFYIPLAFIILFLSWHWYFGVRQQRLHTLTLSPFSRALLLVTCVLLINYLPIHQAQSFIYFRF